MTESPPVPPGAVPAAAEALKAAIDRHLAAVVARRGEEDPDVQDAYEALRAAAEAYDDVLFEVHDEVTPFEFAEPEADLPRGSDDDLDDLPVVPESFSVLLRRDYDLVDAEALVEAGRAARAEVDGAARLGGVDGVNGVDGVAGLPAIDDLEDADGEDEDGLDENIGAAVYHLVHAYGVDGLHVRAEEIGLEPTGGTMWLLDEVGGDIDGAPFDGVEAERLRLRLDELYSIDPPL
jgi:hypothetical protein